MSYSLWLRPDRRQTHRLQHSIDALATRYGGLKFSPHVTVCSGMEEQPTTQALRALAARHQPAALDALRVEHSGKLYQCLSLELRTVAALTALRGDALHNFGGHEHCGPYRPHISLLYASLSAAERCEAGKTLDAALLRRSKGDVLQLMLTRGSARHWRVLEEFPLGEQP